MISLELFPQHNEESPMTIPGFREEDRQEGRKKSRLTKRKKKD